MVRFGSLMVVGNHRLLSGGGARWFYHSGALFFTLTLTLTRTLNLSSGADVGFIYFSKFLAVGSEFGGGIFLIFFIL